MRPQVAGQAVEQSDGVAWARTGTALEIYAHPAGLDLPSAHVRAAREAGMKFAIDS